MQKRALVIGINDYTYAPRLRGSINDTILMERILRAAAGFAGSNINFLRDTDATQAGILAGMDWLMQDTKQGDVAVFYFSGQGRRIPGKVGSRPGNMVSTIMPVDGRLELENNLDIAYDIIHRWLMRLTDKSPHVTLIIDANCARGIDRIVKEAGKKRYVFLGACRATEHAHDYQVENVFYGAFTYTLSQTLLSAERGSTYHDVFQRASDQVHKLFPDQHPQIEGDIYRPLSGSLL